jgi:hypothetical protein
MSQDPKSESSEAEQAPSESPGQDQAGVEELDEQALEKVNGGVNTPLQKVLEISKGTKVPGQCAIKERQVF